MIAPAMQRKFCFVVGQLPVTSTSAKTKGQIYYNDCKYAPHEKMTSCRYVLCVHSARWCATRRDYQRSEKTKAEQWYSRIV